RENRESQQINSEGGSELLQMLFDPDFAMVEVFSRVRIIPHQETSPDSSIVNVSDRDFARIEDFAA
ncbi:hypothetical protein, partial [Novipirellula galeiformis]|uniref:hypothetical protein n=1 Tax=Novipirellula galeiformis TaxID=2528004 RepID=UPI0018CEB614